VTTVSNEEVANLTVHNLICLDGGGWNTTMVNPMLKDEDTNHVLKVPFINLDSEDTRLWNFERNGIYSIRFAYRLLIDRILNNSHLQNWSSVWRLKIPTKVKVEIFSKYTNKITKIYNPSHYLPQHTTLLFTV